MALNGGNMRTNVVITEDFYLNADEVRSFALSQEFSQKGNYPGSRTNSFINDNIKEIIQNILRPISGNVTSWNDAAGLTGSFELATSLNRSWMHTDEYNSWAGVCYLTPDAPLSGGTGLFMYKKTGSIYEDGTDYSLDTQDMTKWELVDRIANRYNRLVLYRSNIYHTSLDYFGNDLQDGRLFQLFFINTEY
jgi:hypothetical protein